MMGKWLGVTLVALGLGLAGCAGPAGGRHSTCPQACNRDYDVCAESASASRGGASFFGSGAVCQREVSACLKNCELTVVQTKPAAKDSAKPAAKSRNTPPGSAPVAAPERP